MTIQYRCDGPDCVSMLTEDDTRIELAVVNEPLEPSEDGMGWETARLLHIGFTGTHHFHSAACLGAWAMDRSLNGER